MISLVIPVYNEEESLKPLFNEILKVSSTMKSTFEVIFVDDASNDLSKSILDNFQEEFPEVVRVIRQPQRSGQTKAMRIGLDAVKGDYAVTLDADLQNDPADIPALFVKMKEGGFDCVCGWRRDREDTPLKAGLSKFGNVLQRMFTGMSIHDVSCTLRAYQKKCIPHITLNWEGQHRFIPLSLSLQGYKVGEIVSHHRKRAFGTTKYSHKRIFRVIGDFFRIMRTGGEA